MDTNISIMKPKLKSAAFILLATVIFFVACTKENSVSSVVTSPSTPPPPLPDPPAITNLQLLQFGNLSQARYHLLAATAGNKMIFAGGRYFVPNVYYDSTDNTWINVEYQSTRVDIYDTSTHTWSIAELDGSSYSSWSGVATVGNKIFFTGGYDYNSSDSARVDIYDAALNSWSFINLPSVRRDIAVAALGTKVFFAGGGGPDFLGPTNIVDIYDVSNNTWSTATLSQPRVFISGVSFANKIFFAGGYPLTSRVDIYNGATQSWSNAELSTPKYLIKTATAGNKLLFDVGDGNSDNNIDIYDDSTQSWSSVNVNFPGPPHFRTTASLGNNAFCFMYNSQANIYNSVSNLWSIVTLNQTTEYGHKAAIAVGNQIYLAGGFDGNSNSDKVWRVQF